MKKELYLKSFQMKDYLDNSIGDYIKKAFEYGETMFFYRTQKYGLGKDSKYQWFQLMEHKEYDKLKINARDERYSEECIPKKDKHVFAFDISNPDIREKIKSVYRFPIGYVIGDLGCKIKNDDTFSDDPGYDGYNVVISKGDEVLLNCYTHEFTMLIDSKIIYEVDKTHKDIDRQ